MDFGLSFGIQSGVCRGWQSLSLWSFGGRMRNGEDHSRSVDLDARHRSPWTFRERLGRTLWGGNETPLFRWSPRPRYRWRNFLLRRFGAKIHTKARIRPTAIIEVPWNLSVGPNSSVGDHAVLYCLGPITLGARVSISQYAHL